MYIYIQSGICECSENYTGSDCSEDVHHVPTIYDLAQNGFCDRYYQPCRQFPVYGDFFHQGNNVTCQLQVQDVSMVMPTFPSGIQSKHT